MESSNYSDSEETLITRKKFIPLFETLPTASILFPGSKAYEQAVFIGNLLYKFVTPSAVVQAVTEQDVIATVSFARKKGYKLTVKSGGHSYAGYCLNEGGIVLDLSTMNKVSIDHDNMTVSMQGGAVWLDAYSLLKEENLGLIMIGGQCPTVGVSAFLLGGGLSPFSRCYGLGADNVVEMRIVTANGKIVTVRDEDSDPDKRDLFWAIRGGGGGNFGITIGVKAKMHKLNNRNGIVVCGQLTWKIPEQETDFNAMMKVWNTTDWPVEVTGDALWRFGDEHGQLLGQMTMIYNGTMDNCRKALAPLLAFHPDDGLKEMHWTDWEAIDAAFDPFQKDYTHHASFIFGEGGITPELTSIIADTMKKVQHMQKDHDVSCHFLWDHIGGATAKPRDEDTAFVWRDGVYVSTLKAQWTDYNMTDTMMKFVNRCQERLAPHSLYGIAAYVNYIDDTLENWPEAYYGRNYARLQRIKAHWDPSNFFRFRQSIRPARGELNRSQEGDETHEPDSWQSDWGKHALRTPRLLGHPKTLDEVFSIDARVRLSLMNQQSQLKAN